MDLTTRHMSTRHMSTYHISFTFVTDETEAALSVLIAVLIKVDMSCPAVIDIIVVVNTTPAIKKRNLNSCLPI